MLGGLLFAGCNKEAGEQIIALPEVNTVAVTDTGATTALFHGVIMKTGNSRIKDYGFCYSMNHDPSLVDSIISNGDRESEIIYKNLVSNLNDNTTYYVRAYAINEKGATYGEELAFKTFTRPLSEGLVAYYPFNADINDESGNGNNGIATGGMFSTDKNGVSERAYRFSGSDYIKISNSLILSSIEESFTISAWIYNEQDQAYIVCKSAYNGLDMQFRLYADNGMLHFANFGKTIDINGLIAPVNTWKHIVVTSNGIVAKYYLNGVLQATVSLNETPGKTKDNTSELYIGADTHGVTEFYAGKLDEIRIYNRVLNDKEIEKLFTL